MKSILFITLFGLGFSITAYCQKVLCKISTPIGQLFRGGMILEDIEELNFLLSVDSILDESLDNKWLVFEDSLENGKVQIMKKSEDILHFSYFSPNHSISGDLVIPPRHNIYSVLKINPITYEITIKYYPFFKLIPIGSWIINSLNEEKVIELDSIIFEDKRDHWPTEFAPDMINKK